LLHDRGLGAIPLAAITAMNDEYVVFEMNWKKKVRKKGVIKISDIQAISEARISEKKAASFGALEIFDLNNADNPYKLFTGKKCAIKLRRSDFSRSLFSGDVYVDWLPSAEIIAVTDENLTVLFNNKEMLVRNDDVLTVIED
jgi:hypothetical protein